MNCLSPILRHLVAAVIVILTSAAAEASSVTFNNVANSVVRGGVYSGLYSLTVDAETLLAMCDARYSQVGPPTTWTANVLDYATIQAGAVGKFNSPSTAATLTKYSQAGWLFGQLATLAPASYSAQADIQEAIWKIMTPGYALVGAGAGAYYTAATNGTHDAFDWSGTMRVATPYPLVQHSIDIQEFLIAPAMGTVVPAPPAIWLFGSALGGLGWLRRRIS